MEENSDNIDKIVKSGTDGPVLFIDDIPEEFSGETLEEIHHNAKKAIKPSKPDTKEKVRLWKRWIRRAADALTRLSS